MRKFPLCQKIVCTDHDNDSPDVHIPYFFSYKTEKSFFLPKQSQKSRFTLQDRSRFLELFWKGKTPSKIT